MVKDISGEFARPNQAGQAEGAFPAGHYSLPGRADMAHLAQDPANAHIIDIVHFTRAVTDSLDPEDAIAFRAVVRETFPAVAEV